LITDKNESINFKTSILTNPSNPAINGAADEDSGDDTFRPVRKTGKATMKELMHELRIKYLTILKSMYWNKFEKG